MNNGWITKLLRLIICKQMCQMHYVKSNAFAKNRGPVLVGARGGAD